MPALRRLLTGIMMRKWQLFTLIVGGVLLLDQGTKFWVYTTFELGESRPVLTHFLSWTYVQNPGAAFGLLSGYRLGDVVSGVDGAAVLAIAGGGELAKGIAMAGRYEFNLKRGGVLVAYDILFPIMNRYGSALTLDAGLGVRALYDGSYCRGCFMGGGELVIKPGLDLGRVILDLHCVIARARSHRRGGYTPASLMLGVGFSFGGSTVEGVWTGPE